MAKLKQRPKPEVPSVSGDPAVADLEAKLAKFIGQQREVRLRIEHLDSELAALPDPTDVEARRLLGETIQTDTKLRDRILGEKAAAVQTEAALGRACELLAAPLDAARTAAAEKIGVAYNRDVVKPLMAEVGEAMSALVESVTALSEAAEAGLFAKVPVSLGMTRFNEFLKQMNNAAVQFREASAA